MVLFGQRIRQTFAMALKKIAAGQITFEIKAFQQNFRNCQNMRLKDKKEQKTI